VKPSRINFRRWQDGDAIGLTDLTGDFAPRYGAPYFVVHRAHLHTALHEEAVALGVRMRLGSKVSRYEPETGAVHLADGSFFQGDLVVAADGWSFIHIRTANPAERCCYVSHLPGWLGG
jgi:salicylate hydroxylase